MIKGTDEERALQGQIHRTRCAPKKNHKWIKEHMGRFEKVTCRWCKAVYRLTYLPDE